MKANLDYIGPIPDIKYFGVDEMVKRREGPSSPGMRSRKTRYLITGVCWNSIARMTSASFDRRVRFSGAILWRSEISRFS